MFNQILIFALSLLCLILLGLVIYQKKNATKHKQQKIRIKNESKLKEQTTNLIVHDLKAPLATLLNVELIDDEQLRLKMIKQASIRMMILVQNVLDIYRHENSNVKLKKEFVNMNTLVKDIVDDLKIMTEIKSLTFKINEAEDSTIIADLELIRRTITNILSNSIKFSPTRGEIEIKMESVHNKFVAHFYNEGPGIPKEKQALIFNRFEQAQIQNFGKLPSTGLGLHFCQLAIKAHNGKIGVISDSDKGVDFWFSLPKKKNGNSII